MGIGREVRGELINSKELECAVSACRVVEGRDNLEMTAGVP